MTDTTIAALADNNDALDPLGDADEGLAKNRAKVGSARPSSLLYTYGPGAIMDLPSFSVMPAGLDDWEPIWKRREVVPTILEPRLLNVVNHSDDDLNGPAEFISRKVDEYALRPLFGPKAGRAFSARAIYVREG